MTNSAGLEFQLASDAFSINHRHTTAHRLPCLFPHIFIFILFYIFYFVLFPVSCSDAATVTTPPPRLSSPIPSAELTPGIPYNEGLGSTHSERFPNLPENLDSRPGDGITTWPSRLFQLLDETTEILSQFFSSEAVTALVHHPCIPHVHLAAARAGSPTATPAPTPNKTACHRHQLGQTRPVGRIRRSRPFEETTRR